MSKYLLVREDKYRVDSEGEVEILIEELKDGSGELVGYATSKKTTKTDEYFIVKARIKYNNEKDPIEPIV